MDELAQPQAGSSASLTILVVAVIIGSIYYVLNEAIKRRQREEETEKYEAGGDNLLGGRSSAGQVAQDHLHQAFNEVSRMGERFAKGVLDQFENRYGQNNGDRGGPQHMPRELMEQPSMSARPLESLASQSQSILGSTGSPAEGHAILGDETLGLKDKRKKGDKKKLEEAEDDDQFD